jgi:hypothetical protein
MREIDPQSGDPLLPEDPLGEDRLTKALRHMATSSQQSAPAELSVSLAAAFRGHHTRRRRVRKTGIAGLVACIALMAGLISLRTLHHLQSIPSDRIEAVSPSKSSDAKTITAALPAQPKPARKRPQAKGTTSSVTYSRQFLALPGYDPAVPADELHVVRAQLPASALWQMGAPVNPDGAGGRVMADFVVSQDGTPYAVRLVQ